MSAQELKALVDDFTSYFVSLYERDPAGSDAQPILSTLPIGIPVSLEELRLSSDDPSPATILATEWMSLVANEVPDIDGMQLFRTSRTVDNLYELILRGAQLLPGAPAANQTLFDGVKASAMRNYDNAALGSVQGIATFHAVTARPASWADPNAQVWTERTFKSSSSTTVTPKPTQPTVPWTLQVVPKAIATTLAQPKLLDQTIAAHKAAPRAPAVMAAAPKAIAMQPKVAMSARVMAARPFVAMAAQPTAVAATVQPLAVAASPRNVAAVSALKSARMARTSELAETFVTKSPAISVQETAMLSATKLASISVAAGRALELAQIAEPHQTEASNVSISFEYCLVSLSRSWLDLSLLNLRGWYIPGFRKGDMSSGQLGVPESADTLFEALPAAALLIRNLRLTASWTSEEVSLLGESAGFGPFSLVGRSYDAASGTVRCDGTQLVGWVCEPLPVLPPESDPNAT